MKGRIHTSSEHLIREENRPIYDKYTVNTVVIIATGLIAFYFVFNPISYTCKKLL